MLLSVWQDCLSHWMKESRNTKEDSASLNYPEWLKAVPSEITNDPIRKLEVPLP